MSGSFNRLKKSSALASASSRSLLGMSIFGKSMELWISFGSIPNDPLTMNFSPSAHGMYQNRSDGDMILNFQPHGLTSLIGRIAEVNSGQSLDRRRWHFVSSNGNLMLRELFSFSPNNSSSTDSSSVENALSGEISGILTRERLWVE